MTVAREEIAHGLHGEEMTVGETAGRTWRSAAGWFGYTLRIYEDTPLTVVCVFAGAADLGEAFDILVDDRKVATRVREPGAATNREFKVTLPLAETAGKSQVTVTFRAHPGARTAQLARAANRPGAPGIGGTQSASGLPDRRNPQSRRACIVADSAPLEAA